MPLDPTPRLGLHRPSGGDDADVPTDLATLTDQLDAKAGGAPDRGTLEARNALTPYPGQLYEVINWPGGSGTTRLLTIADDAGQWHPVTPVSLSGDLAGSALPDARVSSIAAVDLAIGAVPRPRRAIAEHRALPAVANQVTMLGVLAHDGATITASVVTTRSGVQTAARYELAATPSLPTTSWRIAPMSSGPGGDVHLVASVDASGLLLLGLWRETAVAGETSTVTLDVTGGNTWTPAATSSTVAGIWSLWTHGGALGLLPIGAPFEWPAGTTPQTPMTVLEFAGQVIARSAYPLLFAAWGITAMSSYVMPNRAGRMLMGAGAASGLTTRTVGTIGGSETYWLPPNETPIVDHVHNLEAVNLGGTPPPTIAANGRAYVRGSTASGAGSDLSVATTTQGSFSYGIGVGGIPGGSSYAANPVRIMPPFAVTRWFVRAK